MLAVARFAELVGAGSVRRWRVREWRTVTAVLERSITATGHDVFLLGAAAPILRWALLEIAAEGMRELTVGRR